MALSEVYLLCVSLVRLANTFIEDLPYQTWGGGGLSNSLGANGRLHTGKNIN
jgi:hypothetical protein